MISSLSASATQAFQMYQQQADPLQESFQEAVGGMLYGQMLKSLRSTVGKPAYLHGGAAEEMFQSQMDQHVVESLAKQRGADFMGELFERFQAGLEARNQSFTDPSTTAETASSAALLQRPQHKPANSPSFSQLLSKALSPSS